MGYRTATYLVTFAVFIAEVSAGQTDSIKPETQKRASTLLDQLTQQFTILANRDPHQAELEKAATLLESTNESDRWNNYASALKILRQHRSKAGIPLIMRYMIEHAKLSIGASAMRSYTETLCLLSGRKIENPYHYQADRFTPVVDGVQKMVDSWWTSEADSLAVDLQAMSDRQLRVVVDALLEKQRWNGNYARDPSGNYDPTAYRLYHVLFYDIMNQGSSRERSWRPEELAESMTPILLEIAGYEPKPSKTSRDTRTIPFEMVHMLAWLRKNGQAPQLNQIVNDARQNASLRIVCILALYSAGERLQTDPLISMLSSEARLERRLTIILALQQSTDTKTVLPVLLRQLDDPNNEVRSAAVYALHNHGTDAILPRLQTMLAENDPPGALDNVLDVIGEMQTENAQSVLVEFMRKGLDSGANKKYVPDALGAFATATDRSWYEAGAHPQSYYLEKAKEAIRWWDSRSPKTTGGATESLRRTPVAVEASGNRGVDATRQAVNQLMSHLDGFQLKLTYRGPHPKAYASALLSVAPVDSSAGNVEVAQISHADAILLIGHFAGNGFLFRSRPSPPDSQVRVADTYYELLVTNGRHVFRDVLPWAGRSYRWKEQPWPRTFDQVANLRGLLLGDAAKAIDQVAAPLEEIKESILHRSKRWKRQKLSADFRWLMDNAVPTGSPKYHVREILGEPMKPEVTLPGRGSMWVYLKFDPRDQQDRPLSVSFDANGRSM